MNSFANGINILLLLMLLSNQQNDEKAAVRELIRSFMK
jgi:hypothetical protein